MLNWVRNASFRLKVVLAPLCAIVCMVAVSFIGYAANNSLSGSLVSLGEVRVPKIVRAAELDQKLRSIHILVNQSLAWEGAGFKAAKIEELDRSIISQMAAYDALLQDVLEDSAIDDVERFQLATMATEFHKYRQSATEALDIKTGMLGNAVFHMTTMEGSFGRLHGAIDTLIEHERTLSTEAVGDARTLASRNLFTIVAGLLLALAAAVATAWLMASAMQADFREKNQALVQAYHAIEEASLTDPLTGLRNRRFLEQQLGADVSLSVRRYNDWLADRSRPMPIESDLLLFMVDIDHFKALNDSYGHAVGDKVLTQMRQRLQEAFRESDYLVRWGGEEFLVVARGTKRTDAETIAERIRVAVSGRPFDVSPGVTVSKTCSVGFAAFPFLPMQPEALNWLQVVEVADQGLYMAKRGGRDAWVGLIGTEGTRFEDVHRWLVSDPKDAAIQAGMLVAHKRGHADPALQTTSLIDSTSEKQARVS
jgi:diguanylate cyclase (GGDEF)-like protein